MPPILSWLAFLPRWLHATCTAEPDVCLGLEGKGAASRQCVPEATVEEAQPYAPYAELAGVPPLLAACNLHSSTWTMRLTGHFRLLHMGG